MSERTKGRAWLSALAIAGLALVGGEARALSLRETNLVELLRQAESIVVGNVTNVSDGVTEAGLPYTEVTLTVEENIRGEQSGTYTFRQIGLLAPRPTADGTRIMAPAPEGLPRYSAGERVLLFLGPQAIWTGLRTTVGLGQGKFVLGAGRAENGFANEGVFGNVSVESRLVADNDLRMLETKVGAVNPDTLLSFVRRAVDPHWVETCQMWDTAEGKTCGAGRRTIDRAPTRTRVNPGAGPVITNIGER